MSITQADLASGLAEINNLSTDELKEWCNATTDEKYQEIVNRSDKVSCAPSASLARVLYRREKISTQMLPIRMIDINFLKTNHLSSFNSIKTKI